MAGFELVNATSLCTVGIAWGGGNGAAVLGPHSAVALGLDTVQSLRDNGPNARLLGVCQKQSTTTDTDAISSRLQLQLQISPKGAEVTRGLNKETAANAGTTVIFAPTHGQIWGFDIPAASVFGKGPPFIAVSMGNGLTLQWVPARGLVIQDADTTAYASKLSNAVPASGSESETGSGSGSCSVMLSTNTAIMTVTLIVGAGVLILACVCLGGWVTAAKRCRAAKRAAAVSQSLLS